MSDEENKRFGQPHYGHDYRIILDVVRFAYTPFGTFSSMAVGPLKLFTCEDPWKNNERDVSCIPIGEYAMRWYQSDKFGRVPLLLGVPERDDILIHVGNTIADTRGCILPGLEFGPVTDRLGVWQSSNAMDALRDYLGYSERMSIRIRNYIGGVYNG